MATQPIIQGIEAVGSVSIKYRYNSSDGSLPIPTSVIQVNGTETKSIATGTGTGVECTGFRLDGTFLDANPQIASSFMIPMLGGGAVALTNNNRSGTLTINTTRVSLPTTEGKIPTIGTDSSVGFIASSDTVMEAYDLTFLLQCQQGATGGDSVGSTITITFKMGSASVVFQFLGCTVASIKPLALSGNDAVDYAASINYLNWTVAYNSTAPVV